MIRSLARFYRLPPEHKLLLCEAAFQMVWLAARLRLRGMKASQPAYPRREAIVPTRTPDLARMIAHAVGIASRHLPIRPGCLPTALALQHLLARRGVASHLRIGVRKQGHLLEAHAWVEHEGYVLLDGPDVHDRFAAFAALPPAGRRS